MLKKLRKLKKLKRLKTLRKLKPLKEFKMFKKLTTWMTLEANEDNHVELSGRGCLYVYAKESCLCIFSALVVFSIT